MPNYSLTHAWGYLEPYIVVEKLRENRGGYPLQYYPPSPLDELDVGDEISITPIDSACTVWVEVSVKRDGENLGSADIRRRHVDNVFSLGYEKKLSCEHFRIVPKIDAEAILAGVPPEDVYV